MIRLLVALSLCAAALPAAAQQVVSRITKTSYDGVIVSAPFEGPTWTPTKDDVASFEKGLASAIAKSTYGEDSRIHRDLAHYKRQYFGLIDVKGRRELDADFFHENSEVVTRGLWLKSYVTVVGGGDDFFRATLLPDGSYRIRVNAPK